MCTFEDFLCIVELEKNFPLLEITLSALFLDKLYFYKIN